MFGAIFRRRVADHPERLGCPVAAAALARPEDPELAAAATAAFQSWERPIAAALREEGVGRADAEAFAGLVVSTVEGALLRARAAGDHAPLDSAVAGLGQALDGLLADAELTVKKPFTRRRQSLTSARLPGGRRGPGRR